MWLTLISTSYEKGQMATLLSKPAWCSMNLTPECYTGDLEVKKQLISGPRMKYLLGIMVSLVPDPKVNFSVPYEDTQCSKSLQKPLLQLLKTLLQGPPVLFLATPLFAMLLQCQSHQ